MSADILKFPEPSRLIPEHSGFAQDEFTHKVRNNDTGEIIAGFKTRALAEVFVDSGLCGIIES